MKSWTQKLIAALILAAILLTSVFGLSRVTSSPEFHAGSIAALDDKRTTVMELTAATALSSIAISMVPGDTTTPIADQVAELCSYLMMVAGVIMLEKFLLTLTGRLAFTYLIPAACVLGILYQFIPRDFLRKLAVRLALFGLAICLVIPASIRVSGMFEEMFQFQQTVQSAQQATEDIQEETEDSAGEEPDGIGGWFSQIGETLTSGATAALEKAKTVLNSFIDAVAILLISNCVIPVLVMFLFLEMIKAVFTLPFDREQGEPGHHRAGRRPAGEPDEA